MNQYDLYYDELKNFISLLGWTDKKNFYGANENEIANFELTNRIKLEEGFKTYLKHFGKTKGIPFLPLNYSLDLIETMSEVEQEFREDMEFEEASTWKESILQSVKTQGSKVAIKQPVILRFIDDQCSVNFTNFRSKDFIIGDYLWDTKKIYTIDFKTTVRRQLFRILMYNPPKENLSYFDELHKEYCKEGRFSKIPWLKVHRRIKKEKLQLYGLDKYYLEANETEIYSDRIMGIDEFEYMRLQNILHTQSLPKRIRVEVEEVIIENKDFYEYLA